MADLLPSRPDVDPPDDPRVIGIDSEDAEDLLSALSSDTARTLLSELHEEPDTPAALARRVDTSLQNVQYHLGRMEDAGLIEVADSVYSEKGREMDVYAPADRALVVVAGEDQETAGLRTALGRLLGGVGVLGLASVVLDRLVARTGAGGRLTPTADGGGDGGDGGGGPGTAGNASTTEVDAEAVTTTTPTETPAATPTATPTPADDGGIGVAEVTTTATEPTTVAETATGTPLPTGTPTPAPSPTPTPAPSPTPTAPPAETATEAARTVADAGGTEAVPLAAAVAGASPGLLFFLGGTTVLVAWFAVWYLRRV